MATAHESAPGMQATLALSSSVSEQAHRKRLEKDVHVQWDNLQLQLEQVERKNQDLIKSRKKLASDLEHRNRECKFYEDQCQKQQKELQTLRGQLESTARITGFKSKSSTSLGTSQQGSVVNTMNFAQISEELRLLKLQNQQMSQKVAASKTQLQDSKLRVKVLEDALAFRSEEIGLAGHADLLAKVAQLKGEVTALKAELTDKSEKITTIQADRSNLSEERETLQHQILAIQQRLAVSQQEAFRYSKGDLGAMLKAVEQERDVLLDYIQQDMDKSASLGKQVEQLESELRLRRKKDEIMTNDHTALQQELTSLQALYNSLDKEHQSLRSEHVSLRRSHDHCQHEIISLQQSIKRQALEMDENMKHTATIFGQLRSKDEELMKKTEDIIILRSRLQEIEAIHPLTLDENQSLKSRLIIAEEEVVRQRKRLLELESESSTNASRVHLLQSELQTIRRERDEMSLELQTLRPLKMMMDDLNRDLSSNDDYNNSSNHQQQRGLEESKTNTNVNHDHNNRHVSFSSPITIRSTTANTNSPDNSETSSDGEFLLSPSPPNPANSSSRPVLSSPMITRDALHELLALARSSQPSPSPSPAQPSSQQAKQTIAATAIHNHDSHSHLTASQQHSLWIGLPSLRSLHPKLYERIRSLAVDLHKKENEASDLNYQLIKLTEDSEREKSELEGRLQYLSSQHQHDHDRLSSLTGKLHAMEAEYLQLRDCRSILQQVRTVAEAAPGQQLVAALSSHDDHTSHSSQVVADSALPSIINEMLLANAQAVLTVQETVHNHHSLQKEHEATLSQLHSLQRQAQELSNEVADLQDKLAIKERKLQTLENDSRQTLEGAAELAERQNALMITLEAKVEGMNRAQQLKSAQIAALQQREETLKGRILSLIEKEHLPLPQLLMQQQQQSAHGGLSLADLVQFLMDHIRRGLGTGTSSRYNNSYSQQQQQLQPSLGPAQMVEEMRPVKTTMLPRGGGGGGGESEHRDHAQNYQRGRSPTPPRYQQQPVLKRSSSPLSQSQSQSQSQPPSSRSSQPIIRHSVPVSSHSSGRVINDRELLSTISERESRSLQARKAATAAAMMSEEHNRDDDNYSHSNSHSRDQTSAAQALQDRLRKAQQAFIAMRSSSS